MSANDIATQHVSYADRLTARSETAVDLLVVHCTELPDLAMAREYAEVIHYIESGTGNCGHFYIDRDGTIVEYAPLDRVAHHVAGLNTRSVGIELVNRGRYPHWHRTDHQVPSEPYEDRQIAALLRLTETLREQLPRLALTAGHEDLDTRRVTATDRPGETVARKIDPGPLFPWDRYLEGSGLERVTEETLPPEAT